MLCTFNNEPHWIDIEDFVPVDQHECIDEGYGIFDTLSKALRYCSSDARCVGIWDALCDNKGDFRICIGGVKSAHEDASGCVYKKSENYGKHNNVTP